MLSFALNVNDLNKQITELQGTASGQLDQARIANLLMERDQILRTQGNELQALLLEAQAAGNQQAVNDLTVAMLENQVAILQNTQALDEANGLMKDPQSFTSTAWTWFREAIFSGMGQVLPQYDPNNLVHGWRQHWCSYVSVRIVFEQCYWRHQYHPQRVRPASRPDRDFVGCYIRKQDGTMRR